MHYLVIVAVLVVLFIYSRLERQKKQADIKGWIVNQDLDGKGKRIYRDKQTGISCKPDVVERNKLIEYKSASVKGKARYSDILQVAAQMIATGMSESELRYDQGVKFTFKKKSAEMSAAMNKVRGIVKRMQWHLSSRITPKGTPTRNKCSVCRFGKECSDAVR